MTAWRYFLLHVILFAAVLSTVPVQSVSLSLPLTAEQAGGEYRSWRVECVAPHPTGDMVYVLDNRYYIHTVNRTNGAILAANVSSDSGAWQAAVVEMAVDGRTNRLYVLLWTRSLTRLDKHYWLLSFTADLQPVANLSLTSTLSPPLRDDDTVFSALPIDTNGNVYIVRQQYGNDSVLVNVVSAEGEQIGQWWAPLPAQANSAFKVAIGPDDRLYFQSFWPLPLSLYITTWDGVLLSTVQLNITTLTCRSTTTVAVSHSGMLALGCDLQLYMFDSSSGARVDTFSYTAADIYFWFNSLKFDADDRLLAVNFASPHIPVISSTTGELLSDWSNGVPNLFQLETIVYEPLSDSLLTFTPQLAILKFDADSGALLQEYRLSKRLTDTCSALAIDVGMSGDIHLLLTCGYWPYSQLVLYSMSSAGRIRREVRLQIGEHAFVMYELLVCEDRRMAYLLLNYDSIQSLQVVAFAFNGTNVFNTTDSRIGSMWGGFGRQLLRVDESTMAVVDSSNSRIALLDLDDGRFINNITTSSDTHLVAAAYDGESWYRSEIPYVNGVYLWANDTIRQYAADGRTVLTEYTADDRQLVALAVSSVNRGGKGQRLYALKDRWVGSVAWWTVHPQ